MNLNNYPHSRPTRPVQLYLLAGLAIFGLAALWLAAFHAFRQVASGPQAFFAATLIEAGLIIEALALIRRPQVWYIWIAVAISLVVSGTYNYIQAATVAPDFNWWQLGTLALGPLAALAFVSLTLGHELSEYQNQVETWQADRATWIEQRRQEAEAYEREQEAERRAYLHSLQEAEQERQRLESERRWQAEQEQRAWERKRQERAERRAQRLAAANEPGERSVPAAAKLERSPELDALLAIVHERAGGQVYSPQYVQDWTGLGRTKTFELLKYGEQLGDVHRIGKGQYMHNGKG